MVKAIAYVNFGRWVVECPYDCGNARTEEPGEPTYYCTDQSGKGGCHRSAPIVWPPNADRIMATLAKRPEKNRGWFPRGHPTAIAWGVSHGESVDELEAETDKHAADEIGQPDEAKRRELDHLLATYGLRLAPDGESLRRL